MIPTKFVAFGTYILDAGNVGAVSITLMTSDGQSYTALMSPGGDIFCNQRFFGIISHMEFIMAEFTSNNSVDNFLFDDTYCANVKFIPTLTQWGFIILALCLSIIGFVVIRQRKVCTF